MKIQIHTILDILASEIRCEIEIRSRTLEQGETKLLFVDCSEIHSFNTFILIVASIVLGARKALINQTDKV